MTDNEIKKALDFCEGYNGVSFCNDCPLFDKDNCVHILSHEAYNLINRQKAEIERLEKELMRCNFEKEMLYKVGVEIQTIAKKEFAERLKKIAKDNCLYQTGAIYETVNVVEIDNLVKEMTEVEK